MADPKCPECGAEMLLLTAIRANGDDFWGCSEYPVCSGSRQVTDTDRALLRRERRITRGEPMVTAGGYPQRPTLWPAHNLDVWGAAVNLAEVLNTLRQGPVTDLDDVPDGAWSPALMPLDLDGPPLERLTIENDAERAVVRWVSDDSLWIVDDGEPDAGPDKTRRRSTRRDDEAVSIAATLVVDKASNGTVLVPEAAGSPLVSLELDANAARRLGAHRVTVVLTPLTEQ